MSLSKEVGRRLGFGVSFNAIYVKIHLGQLELGCCIMSQSLNSNYYCEALAKQGGNALGSVCLSVSLFVCLCSPA